MNVARLREEEEVSALQLEVDMSVEPPPTTEVCTVQAGHRHTVLLVARLIWSPASALREELFY